MAIDELIKDDSKGPDIAFFGVWLSLKDLRRHVVRCTNMRFKHVVPISLKELCHTKISQLVKAFIVENVGRFDISMDNIEPKHFLASLDDLKHDLKSFLFPLRLVHV